MKFGDIDLHHLDKKKNLTCDQVPKASDQFPLKKV
jgi:hypothetical protein